jgi:hypothetical protein
MSSPVRDHVVDFMTRVVTDRIFNHVFTWTNVIFTLVSCGYGLFVRHVS